MAILHNSATCKMAHAANMGCEDAREMVEEKKRRDAHSRLHKTGPNPFPHELGNRRVESFGIMSFG